jgi:hypothetical protein
MKKLLSAALAELLQIASPLQLRQIESLESGGEGCFPNNAGSFHRPRVEIEHELKRAQ